MELSMDSSSEPTILCRFSFTRFIQECAVCREDIEIFSPKAKTWSYEDKQRLLNKLAEMMLDYEKGLCIAEHFQCILLEVLSRTNHIVDNDTTKKHQSHLKFSATLSYLLQGRLYLVPFVLQYFKQLGPFFGGAAKTAEETAQVIQTACHLLSFSPAMFCNLLDWSFLCDSNYLENTVTERYLLKSLSVILKLNDDEKLTLFKAFDNQNVSPVPSDSYPVSKNNKVERRDSQDTINEVFFTKEDLCGRYTIAANILLPRISNTAGFSSDLVAVPSMLKNVNALTIALVSQKAVLLSGSVGSGKTSLVEHFAGLTGRGSAPFLLKVQLGDQTDSKALIGSYCCSEVAGEFVWRPGILTRAVKEGRWLLFEDIDCAPMDVVSILIPLLESRTLSIPEKGNIQASPGFQLFATQRVGLRGGFKGFNSESSMLDHLWSKVHIEPLNKDELQMVVRTRFPNLEPLANKLVDIFSMLSSDLRMISEADTKLSRLSLNKRLSTVRDFVKWCTRVDTLSAASHTNVTAQDIFLEALDCFCATFPDASNRLSVAVAIGAKLNMNEAKVEFVCNRYKPAIHVAPLSFTVGRITLNRKNDETGLANASDARFAFTRHSLVLLESVAVCVSQNEPVLLVGETGTGKTSAIQYLASLCDHTLTVVNMSQQSDSTDLIGGFKPMEMKQLVAPFRAEFEKLFCKSFSRKQNASFLTHVQQCFGKGKWELLFNLMLHSQGAALEKFSKSTSNVDASLLSCWQKIGQRIEQLKVQHKQAESSLAFSFVEGALVKSIKRGDWVLLDEINLATPETLECLNGILESKWGSVVVLERGDAEAVVRHEEFRIFACMNPANDVGKKDLPVGIRNRFTEIFVNELKDEGDLKTLVVDYLKGLSPTAALINGIVSFYLEVRDDANEKLADGSGDKPYYSLRTLCRALKYASRNPHGSILRSVYEGFCISFLTQLCRSSHNLVQTLLQQKILGHVNASSLLKQPLPKPVTQGEESVNFEGYWIYRGNLEAVQSPEYIFTSSVKQNLRDLARIVSGRYFPVLIQGETSVGKTSLINWLAKASGNHCVRINNHEHTDIQEYLGCYTSDERGKLVFKEGILVDAMRKGYWVILDELNLAPTDVLEALNRLLDDNRELFIPEIQEIVKAHPKFMLFATQNPPGQYGGRKALSRAFRNRFVELHFQELPSKELETILHKRCNLPKSYSTKLVNVMSDLQVRRRGSSVFAGKQGFITLRDLFRWAERYSKSPSHEGEFFDWDQQLAEDGYFLLAGRCRNGQESMVVQEVIEKHLRRQIKMDILFGHPSKNLLSSSSKRILSHVLSNCPDRYHHVVFTYNMRRLAVLVGRALEFNEPVLLVGETGCGKTTICQLYSALRDQKLYSVNCHLHTETSDFLGGLRPVRKQNDENEDRVFKLFEWCDGPLVLAMRGGDMFLADEISLADDSVLERLNSVLEPERTLVLAEKGSAGDSKTQQDIDQIVAKQGFQLLATMNPGGDYGKKELSPALRNRFTEIWSPANDNPADVIEIIEHNLNPGIVFTPQVDGTSGVGKTIIQFIDWLKKCNFGKRCTVTVRDFLSWVQFINICSSPRLQGCSPLHPALAYVHGAFLVFLDALGLGMCSPFVKTERIGDSRQACSNFLYHQVKDISGVQHLLNDFKTGIQPMETDDNDLFTISGFSIRRGPIPLSVTPHQYALNAPTTAENAARVLRALQLHRPILLEGSPGVGKTSLVLALAKASGHNLVRMNLSEQTDISDLFGADLPVEGGNGCRFSWCDGPLLQALKSGSWIVLDELNLASQSVLEGLNACFDHRGEIFIPELGMMFQVQHEKTRFFACQNPLSQGGGRKGLPKSFLNRFTQVYIEPLSKADIVFITEAMYPNIDKNTLNKMIAFNNKIYQQCVIEGLYGKQGGLWEFNLRDIFRWCDLMMKYQGIRHWNPVSFVHLIYIDRMRTELDRKQVWNLCLSIFGKNATNETSPLVNVTPSHVQIGRCVFPKSCSEVREDCFQTEPLFLLHRSLKPLESLLTCLQMNWMAILIGPKSCGKTSLVRMSAELTGTKLDVMAMNSATDTTGLLGGYEQVDLRKTWNDLKEIAKHEVLFTSRTLLLSKSVENVLVDVKHLLHLWYTFSEENSSDIDHSQVIESRPPSMLDAVTQLINLTDEAIPICHRNHLPILTFERLKEALNYLHTRLIECNGNPHVSGQFQWVDGQLVQALKRGYWLLIDNVNFCSPSVLDRLNALLEPGGVLSINERGVVDGKIPVVHPHPNFRLILAMDPKHGEISRAMRNRGVEIFLMVERDGESCSQHDLHGILQAVGCRNSRAVNALTSYHEKYKYSLGGTLLNSVHAGSLLYELMQRGKDLKTSFAMSINHVYGQKEERNIDEFLCDLNCMVTQIQQELPPSTFFHQDSTLAMIQRHAIPMVKMLQETTVSHAHIRIAIMLFLEWCNKHNWRLRLKQMQSNVRSIHQNHDFNDICNVAEFSLQEMFQSPLLRQVYSVYEILDKNLGNKLRPAYQPFNIRVNGPVYDYLRCALSSDEEILSLLLSLTNRLYLLGFHVQIEARMKSYSDCLAPKINLSTPLNISFAFSKGLIRSENLPHPGFAHIYPLCRSFQDFLRHLIDVSDIFITDDDAFKLWISLKHYRRFLDVCEARYTQDEDFQGLFGLHWKLFKKETFSTFCENLSKKNIQINIPEEVLSVVRCLDELFTCDDKVAQCHWTLISQFEHPTTFVFEELHDLWDRATKRFLDLPRHNTNMAAAARLSYLKTREQQKVLVKNIESLIKLREEKVQKENAEDILRSIDESTKDIEHQVLEHEVMDGSPSLNVVQQFSKIAVSDESEEQAANLTEIMNCDIFQSLSTVLVNCSFLACLSAMKFVGLQEKLGLRMDVEDLIQQLESYHDYCQKYVKQIPLNTAFIRYLLLHETNGNGLPKPLSSMLQLTDSIAFYTYSEVQSIDSSIEGQATIDLSSSSGSSYSARSFQTLTFPTEEEECNGDLDHHTPIRLNDLKEKVIQFDDLANLFWLNQNYIGIMESKLFDSDWKLLVIAFIRFLHCTTVITSKEFPDVNQLFTVLLGTSKVGELPDELWSPLESVIGDVVKSYGRVCNRKDIQVVQECFQRFICCLKAGMEQVPETADFRTNSSSKLTRGLSWVYLGVLQTTVLRPLGNVDPVEESNVRVRIHKDEIVEVENELQVRLNTEEMLTGVCADKTYRDSDLLSFSQVNPSHVANLVRHRASLKLELSEIGEEIAFRPIPSKFREIRNILDHFSSSVGNYSGILDLLSRLRKLIEYPSDDEVQYLAAIGEAKGMLLNLKIWTNSVKKFLSQLTEYTSYQDILGPYMSGFCQILQGMEFIVNGSSIMLKWKALKVKAQQRKFVEVSLPQDILNHLLPFRNTLHSSFTRCERLLNEKVFNGVEVLCEMSERSNEHLALRSATLKSKIRKLGLTLLQGSVCRSGYTKPRDISLLKNTINYYVSVWLHHEEQRKLMEQEKESLYKFKTKVYGLDDSEEEREEKEIAELFTSFDQEYRDIECGLNDTSMRDKKGESCDKKEMGFDPFKISDFEVNHLCEVHKFLVSALPSASHVVTTLNKVPWRKEEDRLDVVRVIVESYNVAADLINTGNLSDVDLVVDTTQNHLFMSSLLTKSLSSFNETTEEESDTFYNALFSRRRQNYDIYHDCNLKEISRVLPILSRFLSRLDQLLQEWPKHPTLVQLTRTINRIVTFSVTSPVIKILNGLELLLSRAQEWEANASRHVSIRSHLDEVTEMIIRWRKLELSCWSSLLLVCEERAREKANHWWFHIYHVIQQYSESAEGNCPIFRELAQVLQQFMEGSSLGEFSSRLNILYSFYCQTVIDECRCVTSESVKTVLWNVYCYYKQFECQVLASLQKARTPIEKELKDFIKIAKWKDVYYWSMKQAAKKSHYTLLKLVKKYQVALAEPVDQVLSSIGQVLFSENATEPGSWQKIEVIGHLAPLHFKDILGNSVVDEVHEGLRSCFDISPSQMFVKMRKLTQKALGALKYEMLSGFLNELTGEIIGKTHSLQILEVGDKSGKKRAEFGKHIQVRKKRALADLFKALSKLGLSYRRGMTLRQQEALKDPMLVECCDLASRITNGDKIINNTKHPVRRSILATLNNGLEYYQKSVACSTILHNVLPSPSKELSVGDINRIKGFSEDLRRITQRQRVNLSCVGTLYSDLRMIYIQLEELATTLQLPTQPCVLPPQKEIADWTVTLDDVLDISSQTCTNLLLLLEACPNSKIDPHMSPVPQHLSQLSKSCKQDPAFVQARDSLKMFLEEVLTIKCAAYFQTLTLYSLGTEGKENSGMFLATWSHYEFLKSSFSKLDSISQSLDQFVKFDSREHGLGKLAFLLKEKLVKTCSEFLVWQTRTFDMAVESHAEGELSTLRSKVTSTLEGIVLSFQKWFKRREKKRKTDDSFVNSKEDPVFDDENLLEDKYLVENLDDELSEDIATLNVTERTEDLKSVTMLLRETIDYHYKEKNRNAVEICWKIIVDLVPCLSQYVLLVEYYFSQLLLCHRNTCKLHSVLLGIFSELLRKGFCLPPDEEEVCGERATSFEDSESCGIGEGEGWKDVSDQIEDEEQLLGAETEKNKVEQEMDNDFVDEEQHGIEMTDDFEASANDMDEHEENEDEGSDEQNDNDIDQQMGNFDGADEKLDKKLWGDSDDDENDNSEEERGEGVNTEDQSDLVAKEENQGTVEESKKNLDNEDEEKEEAIHELPKDESDHGNLDNENELGHTPNENELNLDTGKPEDMEFSDDLDLDAGSDQEESCRNEEESSQIDIEQESTEPIDESQTKDGVCDDAEDEYDTGNEEIDNTSVKGDMVRSEDEETEPDMDQVEELYESTENWRPESETKGETAEPTEGRGTPDKSTGAASSERLECATNEKEEATTEEEKDGTGSTLFQQTGKDENTYTTTHMSSHLTPEDMSSYRKQLNKSRADRRLGSSDERTHKKPKVIDSSESTSNQSQREQSTTSDLVEHLKGNDKVHDSQVYDAATLEQLQEQRSTTNYDDTENGNDNDEERMDEDWELPCEDNNRDNETKKDNVDRESRPLSQKTSSNEAQDLELPTEEIGRFPDPDKQNVKEWEQKSSFMHLGQIVSTAHNDSGLLDPEECRIELEKQLGKWHELDDGTADGRRSAQEAWHKYELLTSALSQQLCEQLRIVLEPSIANKLKGDYRTGKRLNMRKVISYIASQFRKDKIWLRRTKKSKRQYQILIAVDDSSSMADNHSKQLAFESLALITNALTRLEAGEIAICSFGENVQLLHPFHETFTDQSGASILRQFTFEQKKTKIAQLVDSCTSTMISARSRVQQGTDARLDTSQLLFIVSDGRGIFLEGVETVQRVLRNAKEAGIFLVFVILDNPANKDSVLDIKVPVFRPGQLPELKSYIEQFPFPFYILLRDISALPETLSDSLRQWFELVTNMT